MSPVKPVGHRVQNLASDLERGLLSWSLEGTNVEVTVPQLYSALIDSEGQYVFALAGLSNYNPTHLVGLAPSGEQVFDIRPPPGFAFSYLTHHPFALIAVVASGDSMVENFFDWHFSISPSGVLKRIAPAY